MIHATLLAFVLSYTMPAQSVLRRMSEARADVKLSDLTMTGTVKVGPSLAKEVAEALGSGWVSGELALQMKLTVKTSGRCRLELSSLESGKSLSISNDEAKNTQLSSAFRGAQLALVEACALLSSKGANPPQTKAMWETHLEKLRIDTRTSSLGRFAGAIALVIGDAKGAGPQLWVYKNHFLPARIKLPDTDRSNPFDVRFLDYNNQATGEAFPRSIEVFRATEFQWRFLVLNADSTETPDTAKKTK